MADDRWLVCPLCGWGKKYHTKRHTNTLDHADVRSGPFIDHREVSGGRGSGFPRKYFDTLKEIKDKDEYKGLIDGLREQCIRILVIIGEI